MGQIFLALHFIPSGISGPRLTALERAVDEILGFQSFEQQEPIDGEYMNIRSSGSSVGFLKLFLRVNLFEPDVYLSILIFFIEQLFLWKTALILSTRLFLGKETNWC